MQLIRESWITERPEDPLVPCKPHFSVENTQTSPLVSRISTRRAFPPSDRSDVITGPARRLRNRGRKDRANENETKA